MFMIFLETVPKSVGGVFGTTIQCDTKVRLLELLLRHARGPLEEIRETTDEVAATWAVGKS
jgi:hypothetical protein